MEFEFYKLKDKTRDVEGVLPINGTGEKYTLIFHKKPLNRNGMLNFF